MVALTASVAPRAPRLAAAALPRRLPGPPRPARLFREAAPKSGPAGRGSPAGFSAARCEAGDPQKRRELERAYKQQSTAGADNETGAAGDQRRKLGLGAACSCTSCCIEETHALPQRQRRCPLRRPSWPSRRLPPAPTPAVPGTRRLLEREAVRRSSASARSANPRSQCPLLIVPSVPNCPPCAGSSVHPRRPAGPLSARGCAPSSAIWQPC